MECPVCEKEVNGDRGLASHWGQSSNETHPGNPPETSYNPIEAQKAIRKDHPMKREEVKEKVSSSLEGRSVWNEGLSKEEEPKLRWSQKSREKLSETISGENHWNWKGGQDEEYPEDWEDDLREFIRQLHYSTCQICGLHESEINQKLDVHHWNGDKRDIRWGNLYPLCRSCHMRVEALMGQRSAWAAQYEHKSIPDNLTWGT